MKCNSIHHQLTGYLEDEIHNDLRKKIDAHLKECSHCSEFLIRLKTALELIDEEKQMQKDPYMFTRIIGKLDDPEPLIHKNKFQVVFQTVAFMTILTVGIYSGILTVKNFSYNDAVSVDFQNEIYYLDELQHENMISVLLTDQITQQ